MEGHATFERTAGRFIWLTTGCLSATLSLGALGVLGFYLVFAPETNPLMVAGSLALVCMVPMIALGSLLPVSGLFVIMGRTRPGVDSLRRFAQAQHLTLQYPTLLSPLLPTSLALTDGSVVQSRASRVDGPHLVFSMPTGLSPSFHLGPGGIVAHAVRKALLGDADQVSLEDTRLAQGWRCLSPDRERARRFVTDADAELEALLTIVRGASGRLDFTAGDSTTGLMRVTLPAHYEMPDDLVSVTLDRMHALKARWESGAQPRH